MNIVMMTNTYTPMLGGVARSVSWFTEAFRSAGHRVMVIAPTFENAPFEELDVVRLPAIQNFNGSDFSVRLPLPGMLTPILDEFKPDLIHAHHPFLLGETALRVAALYNVPCVFTHHTMYEQYTHYVPGDSPVMKRFVISLGTEYANLCDYVIAPSESIANVLRERGVTTPIASIPTGIDRNKFAKGNGNRARREYKIPQRSLVIGHVGRLAPEKNLPFLCDAVIRVLLDQPKAMFLVVGAGPSETEIRASFENAGLSHRLRMTGALDGIQLADAYRAMNVFVFASKSETQGMVLAEAMTTGAPVVALDAPGAREVVRDGVNGRLVMEEDVGAFANALKDCVSAPASDRVQMRQSARRSSKDFAMPVCAERMLEVYSGLIGKGHRGAAEDDSVLAAALRRIGEEWSLWANLGTAVSDALFGTLPEDQVATTANP